MTRRYRGLTWDHPRGYEPLAALERACQQRNGHPLVDWQVQPLSGFEEHPIGQLAEANDLIVLDHPHIGEAVAQGCLLPLEDLFSSETIEAWKAFFVGHTMKSYEWNGNHWALPIDAAAQVCAYRPDRIDSHPEDWVAVIRLAERQPVALSMAGPHAFLSWLSICAALGAEPADNDYVIPDAIALEALNIVACIAVRAPEGAHRLNPIELLETMASSDGIAAVPLVFGYVNYASGSGNRNRLAFADAPTAVAHGRHGSVLGGTGVAISIRTTVTPELVAYLTEMVSARIQKDSFPLHQGQPAARIAWQDAETNGRWNDFYATTQKTIESALIRPRFDGYIAFQASASKSVREGIAARAPARQILDDIRRAWQAARSRQTPSFFEFTNRGSSCKAARYKE